MALISFAFLYQEKTATIQPEQAASGSSCKEGAGRYCAIGNCSGLSICTGGVWGGCRWERVCAPGSRSSCIEDGCAYGFRMCNECGTGFGPCTAVEE